MRRVIVMLIWLLCSPGAAGAQELSAWARLDPQASSITGAGGGVEVVLALSQSVPWRARLLAGPPRLVLDFREVDFGPLAAVD